MGLPRINAKRLVRNAISYLAHGVMIILFMAAADLWLHANFRRVYVWVPVAVNLAGALVYFLLVQMVRRLRRG